MSRALFCLFLLVHHAFTPFPVSPCIHGARLLEYTLETRVIYFFNTTPLEPVQMLFLIPASTFRQQTRSTCHNSTSVPVQRMNNLSFPDPDCSLSRTTTYWALSLSRRWSPLTKPSKGNMLICTSFLLLQYVARWQSYPGRGPSHEQRRHRSRSAPRRLLHHTYS